MISTVTKFDQGNESLFQRPFVNYYSMCVAWREKLLLLPGLGHEDICPMSPVSYRRESCLLSPYDTIVTALTNFP